jgi:hypothetical protein
MEGELTGDEELGTVVTEIGVLMLGEPEVVVGVGVPGGV